MKFDLYYLKARLFPAILTIFIPLFVFGYFFGSDELSKFISSLQNKKIISGIAISAILLLPLAELGRIVGKIVEDGQFSNQSEFPTTRLLLKNNDGLSSDLKEKIYKKVESDFDLSLPSKKEQEENIDDSKKRINEVVMLIRAKLKSNKFLLQHNIEYGFIRNLIGGSIVGVILLIINMFIFVYINNGFALAISIAIAACYLMLLAFKDKLLNLYSESYAKILVQQYLTIK